ncbi:MAG: hypothetical protein HY062_11105 [Bacteroidetes bacterium]|nr:hypothetical protein [Bacteroidota bacterium]
MLSLNRLFLVIILLFTSLNIIEAQLVLSSPQTIPADETKRDGTNIKLQAGFKYGAGTSGSKLTLQISTYPNYVESGYVNYGPSCNYPNTNNSLVGEIEGNFSVSLTGSSVYQIPIKISPGTAGMQPNLSLQYSSGSGSGILGLGWNLIGLSTISRVNKVPYLDTKYDAVKLTTNDVFALDGNRLILKSGIYGASGSTYGSELESFSKVTAINQQGNGPSSFILVDKNGITSEYGSSIANAQLTGIGNNTVLSWFVNSTKDLYGNTINYYYKLLSGEVLIDRIEYTINTAAGVSQAYNTIYFEYMPKTEKNTAYIGDKEFRNTQLLKSITSTSNGNLVKKYILNYQYSFNTILSDITEVNQDGTQLKSTTFCYNDPYYNSIGQNSSQNTNLYNPSDPNAASKYSLIRGIVSADINGDGFSDALVIQSGNKYEVLRNDYPSGSLNGGDIGFTSIYNNNNSVLSNTVLASNVFDSDFDDMQEIYTVINDNVNNKYHVQKIANIGTATNPNILVSTIKANQILTNSIDVTRLPSPFYYDMNDYNGDGINDELIIDPEKITINSSLGNKTYTIPSPNTSVARPIDFDGDGYFEIVLFNNSLANNSNLSIDIIKYTSATNLTSILNTNITFAASSQDLLKLVSVGDYNGDGKGDIFYLNETKQNLKIIYSTGSQFSTPKTITNFTALNSGINYNIISPDINNDGINDIIFIENTANATQNYTRYYSIGNQFIPGISTSGKFNYKSIDVLKYYPTGGIYDVLKGYPSSGAYKAVNEKVSTAVNYQLSADFNGDGIYDLVTLDGTQTKTILDNVTSNKTLFLSRITTGLNKQIDIIYANTRQKFDNQKVSVYEKNSNSYSGSLVSYTPNNYLVSIVKYRNTNLINLSQDVRYFYQGAIYHKFGKGLIGFEKSSNVTLSTMLGSISSFTPNATYQVADKTSIETCKFSSSNAPDNITRYYITGVTGNSFDGRSSKSITTYQISQTSAPAIFVAPSSIDNKNYLNSTASVINLTYDLNQNGNLINKTTTYGWPGNTERVENIAITYQNVGTLLNSLNGVIKPYNVTFSSNQTGELGLFSRQSQYIYSGFNLGSIVIKDPNTPTSALTIQYSNFNNFGLHQKTTLMANDIQNRVFETLYDATGRFIIKTINILGDAEEFTYEPKYGSLLSKKSITGLMSTFSYDGLGRLIQSKLPDNTINTISYDYVPQPSTDNVYSKTVRNEGEAYFTTFYNHLGDITGTQTQDVNGKTIVTNNKYDYNTGFLIQSTEPHFQNPSDQPAYLTDVYTYEPIFSRLIKKETFSATAATPPAQPVLTTQNIYTNYLFNPVSKDYSNGSFLYNQGSVTVTDQTNKKIIKTFNATGQLTSIKNYEGYDPAPPGQPNLPVTDYQITNYSYHNNGQPKSITLSSTSNPNPIVHSFDYNTIGQQIQLIDPSAGTINYTYDKLGELLHQDDANGSYDYTYDNLGRIYTKTGSTSGLTSYQYASGVNGKNQIEKITGQNVTTEFTYDALGRPTVYKETVAGGTPKIFTTMADYDKYSNLVKLTYPSGFISKYNYNANGFLTTITDDANNNIWQLNNQNAAGQITDYTYGNGINTTVNYTNLHYLSSITHGTIHKQDYIFDPLKGNLNQRDFYNYSTGTHNREKFSFDGLDRLRASNQVDPTAFDAIIRTNNVDIDEKGNILSKEDAGGPYVYGNSAKPFNLTQISNPTSNVSPNTLSTTYNDIRKVSILAEASTNKQMNFTYGNDDERVKVEYKINSISQYTRYYQNNYEREETATNTKEWTYIYAPTGLAAVYYKPTSTGSGQLLYALTDHLGSPVLLTNSSQQIQEEYSFDSWGRRRNPTDWSYTGIPQPAILHRGFTFHEHIDEFNLINMNGRVYDPVIGRFIAPDNQVQEPAFLQTFNKYAYVFNNPLSYTDPSGWNGGLAQNVYDAPGWGTSYLWNTIGGPSTTLGSVAYDGIMDAIMNHAISLILPGNGSVPGTPSDGGGRGGGANGPVTSGNVGAQTKKPLDGGQYSFTFNYPKQTESNANDANTNQAQSGEGVNWASATLGFIATDIMILEPTDVAWPKWVGYAVAGTVASAYLYSGDYMKKMSKEISRIQERVAGPQGFLYQLIATRSGPYPNLNTGGTTYLNAGDVWKYGITTQGFGRYPDAKINLQRDGLEMIPIFFGNQMEILIQEKIMIYGYYFMNGERPAGNPIFR